MATACAVVMRPCWRARESRSGASLSLRIRFSNVTGQWNQGGVTATGRRSAAELEDGAVLEFEEVGDDAVEGAVSLLRESAGSRVVARDELERHGRSVEGRDRLAKWLDEPEARRPDHVRLESTSQRLELVRRRDLGVDARPRITNRNQFLPPRERGVEVSRHGAVTCTVVPQRDHRS